MNRPQEIAASDRLIVALDFDTAEEARSLVGVLGDTVGFYKVGWQLFLGAGWPFVEDLLEAGRKVFLDLKIGDIENTVRAALGNMPDHFAGQLEMLTLQGGRATVQAAIEGRGARSRPRLLMLTVLSSMDDSDLEDLWPGGHEGAALADAVRLRARMALDAGCEGLIASGESVRDLREHFTDRPFLIVAPGIRPEAGAHDEHKRPLTPYRAILYGADYLVVGRPVTVSDRPKDAARSVISEIERALQDRDRQLGSS
ncbi:MAG: orotidine-5'-phosphate decarboxylase [Gammaproteobacteria bacterium]|nr:orotidine-5'-phosphate decarboxylase [Gammaproteobacteria bacterium]